LLKSYKDRQLDFSPNLTVKDALGYYKLALNILCITVYVMSPITVREDAMHK